LRRPLGSPADVLSVSPFVAAQPIAVDDIIRQIARAGDGGIAVFIGVVRDHNAGREVSEILYEAYEPMAELEMSKIARSLADQHPETRLAMVHRLGRLVVGEASVAVVAASPHRSEAFAVCRAAIEAIKSRVPIWKKEFGPDGASWVDPNAPR
jgi:molybdopterin synthase catalytic subunit